MANRHTPFEEWRKLADAVERHGEVNAAARELGVKITTARSRYIAGKARYGDDPKRGMSPDHDMTHPVPDGYVVKGVSTLYDADGELKAQWVKSSIDQQRQDEINRAALDAFKDKLPKAKPVKAPNQSNENLAACYPIGDHHLGMLSWAEETGADYDLSIGEEILAKASEHLISVVPPCGVCVIAILGDFMHYDSHQAMTPTNRNMLDTDTRFPKMVRAAIRSIRRMTETALKRHAQVKIIVEIGNHDLASAIWLMECLSSHYDSEPRVSVDTSPMHYHYFRFGKCLVGTHHGDGAKMERLPLIMAMDRPEDWGQTEYRYWLTGHVHHDAVKDIDGCRVESFRILAPTDAWAANKGYRSARDMKAIVYHKEYGEVARHVVNPSMVA